MPVQLIVNADDFGETAAVNAAVVLAHRQGLVTSASLMVTGDAWEQAVALARAHPRLRVGLHVVLLYGRPCLPPEQVPLLVGPNGEFPRNPLLASLRWFFLPAAREQVRREVWAQVERFQQTGLPLDHLNAHLHFHVHPVVCDVLLEVAERVGVRGVRLPAEPWRVSLPLDRRHLSRKLGYVVTFGLLARFYRPRFAARGVVHADGVFGLLQTGEVDAAYLERLMERLPDGAYELYMHPRLDTAGGLRELEALLSPRVRAAAERRGVRFTTYTDLAKVRAGGSGERPQG